MNIKISDLAAHVIFALLCAILFIGQTFIYLNYKFNELAKPFESNQELWEYVFNSMNDIWREMLIWPALVFLLLVLRISSLRKSQQNE